MKKFVSFIFCFLFALSSHAQISDIDFVPFEDEPVEVQAYQQDDSK